MDKRSPVEEGRTSSADLKQEYSAIARLSKTSAQNASVIPQVQLVTQNVFNFFMVLIFVFWSWVTKVTKFETSQNFLPYGNSKGIVDTVYKNEQCCGRCDRRTRFLTKLKMSVWQ